MFLVVGKKRKALDPLEVALIDSINSRMTQRESRKNLNECDQWGQWLAQELQNFSNVDRL